MANEANGLCTLDQAALIQLKVTGQASLWTCSGQTPCAATMELPVRLDYFGLHRLQYEKLILHSRRNSFKELSATSRNLLRSLKQAQTRHCHHAPDGLSFASATLVGCRGGRICIAISEQRLAERVRLLSAKQPSQVPLQQDAVHVTPYEHVRTTKGMARRALRSAGPAAARQAVSCARGSRATTPDLATTSCAPYR